MKRARKKKTHCKRGHSRSPENIGSKSTCKLCLKITSKRWWDANPEKAKDFSKSSNAARRGKRKSNSKYMKKYYADHREEQLASVKKQYKEDPKFKKRAKERSRVARLKKSGWTPKAVEEVKKEQSNRCAICNEIFMVTPNADHDHKTGKPRGLLCGNHNRMLGLAEDDPCILEAAAAYLRKWGR
jgi:hypothetical protein